LDQKNNKIKPKQKTKNNKTPSQVAVDEHNIVDILRRHDLASEIHARLCWLIGTRAIESREAGQDK
jgi:hypothetical protein